MIKRAAVLCLTALWVCGLCGSLPVRAEDMPHGITDTISLDVLNPTEAENVSVGEDPDGGQSKVLLTEESGFVQWSFEAPGGVAYTITVEYYPLEGRGVSIERRMLLNGQNMTAESGAQTVQFSRIWADAEDIKEDSAGNQLRPVQVEVPAWREVTVKSRYSEKNLTITPDEGTNVLRLESVREPMAIRRIQLTPTVVLPTYEEYAVQQSGQPQDNDEEPILWQAEDMLYKSDASLYAVNDRTSVYTQPSHPSRIKLNTVGGSKWKYPGQWISWEVPVTKAGYYSLSLRCRQNLNSGQSSSRTLYINGVVPFAEAEALEFAYDTNWQVVTLGNETGAYHFYLEPGVYTICMEAAMGAYAQPVQEIVDSLEALNDVYRQILMITGADPDPYRDYYLDKELPEVMATLERESARLKEAVSTLLELNEGEKGILTSAPERLYHRIDDMLANPDLIPSKFSDFKETLVALGSWLLSVREQPLEIDYFILSAENAELPNAEGNFWERLVYSWQSFLATFFNDYSTAGNVYEQKEAITVWMTSGRDQVQTLKQLVDNDFWVKHGVGANVRLVPGGTLLSATLAGVGPDVALNCGQSDPVNYALRRAVVDLTQFSDFDEVVTRFYDSALVPYRLQNGCYALPETQSFPMLFYRTDILEQLGLDKPETWEDVLHAIPVLQKKNMQFGIGSDLNSFGMLLYQAGGSFYNEDGSVCVLDDETAIGAFKKWTSFYTSYSLPVSYDFANRFRSGEMPIAIVDYSTYNLLSVFAPEIDGLWAFDVVPGTYTENGEINRAVPSTGTSTVIMSACKDLEAAWTFLKWWTSADVQARYGTELEYVLGASARYATANKEAMKQMPWTYKEAQTISSQWERVSGIPEVPGGYFLSRQVTFAFRAVVVSGKDPRESLLDYTEAVNEEIVKKRKEFALFLEEGVA